MTRGRDGKPELRLVSMNDPSFLAPCRQAKGCPKGTPEKPRSLRPENQRCLEHYRECKAVGQFPDDPIVRRNAAIILEVEEEVQRREKKEFQQLLGRLALSASLRSSL